MAQRIVYVDDLDGTEGATTQTFTFNGDAWEIDLSEQNATKLRDALAPFIDKARKTSTAKPQKRASRVRAGAESNRAIRDWAAENGLEVPARGRIPQKIVDAYNAR